MSLTAALNTLCLPSLGAIIGLGLGLLWRASQVARMNGLSLPTALRHVVDNLLSR